MFRFKPRHISCGDLSRLCWGLSVVARWVCFLQVCFVGAILFYGGIRLGTSVLVVFLSVFAFGHISLCQVHFFVY